jgi:hypothetical protein
MCIADNITGQLEKLQEMQYEQNATKLTKRMTACATWINKVGSWLLCIDTGNSC